jgi:hypothetical protein
MNRILAIFIFFNLVLANATFAQNEPLQFGPYKLSQASALVRVCELEKANSFGETCLSYVTAISDMYFLMYPQCKRPDLIAFNTQVYDNIRIIAGSMSKQKLESESAVSIVYQAVATAYPCQVVAETQARQAPDAVKCKKGMELLGNDWANSFQKQAVLELLRNSGCLNQ